MDRTISVVISLFLSWIWLWLLKMLLEYTFPFAIFLFGFLFITFIIRLVIYHSFFNKNYIYTLILDKDYICINYRQTAWTEIAETCIMNKQEGRTTNSYLILFKKDKTIEKLDLYKFGIPDVKLAAMVEYYKNNTNENPG